MDRFQNFTRQKCNFHIIASVWQLQGNKKVSTMGYKVYIQIIIFTRSPLKILVYTPNIHICICIVLLRYIIYRVYILHYYYMHIENEKKKYEMCYDAAALEYAYFMCDTDLTDTKKR